MSAIVARVAAGDRFAALVRRELGRATKQHAAGFSAPAALAGAGNDQVEFELDPAMGRAAPQ
jgi:hypothetical protein